jgi:hypothetical protein
VKSTVPHHETLHDAILNLTILLGIKCLVVLLLFYFMHPVSFAIFIDSEEHTVLQLRVYNTVNIEVRSYSTVEDI